MYGHGEIMKMMKNGKSTLQDLTEVFNQIHRQPTPVFSSLKGMRPTVGYSWKEEWLRPQKPEGYSEVEVLEDKYYIYSKDVNTPYTIRSIMKHRQNPPIPMSIKGKHWAVATIGHRREYFQTRSQVDQWIMEDKMGLHDEDN